MKIIAVCNVSNADDPSCDSGLIYQRILSDEITKLGHEYLLLLPKGPDYSGLNFSCSTKEINLGIGRYSSRFNFDWHQLADVIHHHKPDILFNNQVELTTPLKALLVENDMPTVRLVTYCHYPALWEGEKGDAIIDSSLDNNNLGFSIVSLILSAIQVSDAFIVQSMFAANLLLKAANNYGIKLNKKISVVPPPCDPALLEPPSIKEVLNKNVLYNHRLYKSYGTDQLLRLIKMMQNRDANFIISDPMPNRSEKRSMLNSTPKNYIMTMRNMRNVCIFSNGNDRSAYKSVIQRSALSLAAFRPSCVWSMSCIDSMGMGIPVIAPRYAAYPEFIPEDLLFSNLEQAVSLIDRILSNQSYWISMSKKSYENAMEFSPSIISGNIMKIFRDIQFDDALKICI